MPRVKIDLPPTWAFATEIPVRVTDLNYGRHVGNDTLLAYIQESRVQWLRKLGYPSELLAEPIGLILVDASIRFKGEAALGDVLRVELAATDWSKLSFEVTARISKVADGAEVARATTGFTFFDYSAHRLAPPPAGFREALAATA